MASGIRFFAGSGAMGNTVSSLYANGRAEPGLEILNYNQNLPFVTNKPMRIGFFGAGGAPSSPVRVGQFQDRTHVCDHLGNNLGVLCNWKYATSTTAYASGVHYTASPFTAAIPMESGILLRFMATWPWEGTPTAVQTQNGLVRAIDLDATGAVLDFSSSNRASTVVVYAAELRNTYGFTGDTSWTKISDTGSDLSLENQPSSTVHDFNIILSASPTTAGANKNFAIYVELEYY